MRLGTSLPLDWHQPPLPLCAFVCLAPNHFVCWMPLGGPQPWMPLRSGSTPRAPITPWPRGSYRPPLRQQGTRGSRPAGLCGSAPAPRWHYAVSSDSYCLCGFFFFVLFVHWAHFTRLGMRRLSPRPNPEDLVVALAEPCQLGGHIGLSLTGLHFWGNSCSWRASAFAWPLLTPSSSSSERLCDHIGLAFIGICTIAMFLLFVASLVWEV